MGAYEHIQEGDEVRTTGRIVQVPVGPELLGRTVERARRADRRQGRDRVEAAGADRGDRARRDHARARQRAGADRHPGDRRDDPDRRGQRELIIGDRQTGKTAIMLDTIINQKGKGPLLHLRRDRPNAANIARVRAHAGGVRRDGVHDHRRRDGVGPGALNYIAPYTGCAMGEYFRDKGQHALVCYDDLTKHAWAYRELALTLRRPPGREAYPGDVFYLHSRLLERAAKLSEARGGGSLTALPVNRDAGQTTCRLHPDQRHLDHGRPDLTWRPTSSTPHPARPSRSASRCPGSAATRRSGR